MNKFDKAVLRVTEGRERIKRDGIATEIKRVEAVQMKQIEPRLPDLMIAAACRRVNASQLVTCDRKATRIGGVLLIA